MPSERAAFATIVRNLDAVDDSSSIRGMTSLRGWHWLPLALDLALDATDPCINRVVGMWCEDGHGRLVSVFLPGAGDAPAFTGSFDPL